MRVHPEFNPDTSSCFNCAAFIGYASNGSSDAKKVLEGGSCHRYAPRPVHAWTQIYAVKGEEPIECDTSNDIVWPTVHDEFFCCEWLPNRATGKP